MMGTETLAIGLGLGSAMAWGAGDFAGGLASRKGNMMGVVFTSQVLGGFFLAGMGLLAGEAVPPLHFMLYGALAGVFGNMGLLALYRGLALGRMGIVAPLSAVLTALVPVGYSMCSTGLPSGLQLAGMAFFLVAIWLLSAGESELKMTLEELGLSVGAGLAFGLFFIFIDKANDLAIFWPLVSARIASVGFLSTVLLVSRKPVGPMTGLWKLIIFVAVFDALGNLLFSAAAQMGRLDISAVLGSLYPAATVALAWVVLKERLGRKQWMGVALAFVALVFISV